MEEFRFTGLLPEPASDSISIKWLVETNVPEEAIRYEAVILRVSDNDYFTSGPLQKTDSYTFTNLKEDTEYLIMINASFGNESIDYPADGLAVKTLAKKAPQIERGELTAVAITSKGFIIKWNKEKDRNTRYNVFLKEADAPEKDWESIVNRKNIGSTKVKDVKADTEYVFYVDVFDGTDTQLRHDEGKVRTKVFVDKQKPTASDTSLNVFDITPDGFTLKWMKATDNVTPGNRIRYEVRLIEHDETDRSKWKQVAADTDIDSARIDGLKPDTGYDVWVHALDEAGLALTYPNGPHFITVKTQPELVKEARVTKLDISVEQRATVLLGVNTIRLTIDYEYIHVNEKGVATGGGNSDWVEYWSNNNTKNDVIDLDEDGWDCHFLDNQVHVTIHSRKAPSAGLNKWVECCSGFVDISKGVLKIRMVGKYIDHSIRLGGPVEEGYARFK